MDVFVVYYSNQQPFVCLFVQQVLLVGHTHEAQEWTGRFRLAYTPACVTVRGAKAPLMPVHACVCAVVCLRLAQNMFPMAFTCSCLFVCLFDTDSGQYSSWYLHWRKKHGSPRGGMSKVEEAQ